MLCARSSVDSGSYLVSAGVKDKELHLFNFTSTVKQILGLNRAKSRLDSESDAGFCSVWDTCGLKCRKVQTE